MIDVALINTILQKGKLAAERVRSEFNDLSVSQLNWKSSPDSWSIAQCLDHLVVANSLYFPTFEKIVLGKYDLSVWEKWSPLSGLFGKALRYQMQEEPKSQMKTAKIFFPSSSQIDTDILDRFQKHLDTLLGYFASFSKIDIDKTRITSPVSKFITYSLRDTIIFLTTHLHRHINQAVRMKLAYHETR